MRRLWLVLSIAVLLAACSSAPQTSARKGRPHTAGRVYETRPPGFPNFVDHSVGREEISIQAMGLVGIPYRWGGNTPGSGFDCSGLVHYVLARSANVNLPRTTAAMSHSGEPIRPDEIAAGDLVFFNTTGRPHSHVGIYVGKLRFVNAPSTGGTVRIDYLNNPYWAKHFDGIRRVAPARRAPTPFDAPTWEASAPPVAPASPVAAPPREARLASAGRAAPVSTAATLAAPPAAAAASVQRPVVAAAPPADAFEPPPSAMSAAQRQALAAGAVSPPVEPAAGTMATTTATAAAANAAPDPIDTAADAFEPPPPASVAARQAEAAQAERNPAGQAYAAPDSPPPGQARLLRASSAARGVPAPTQTSDDPIARFAGGSY